MESYLDNPYWCFLFASQYTFSSDDATCWVHGAVQHVDGNNMRAVGIGVLMPHSDYYVRPWMTVMSSSELVH